MVLPYHCPELRATQSRSRTSKRSSSFFGCTKFPHATRPDAGECINDVVFDLYGTKLVPQTGVTPPLWRGWPSGWCLSGWKHLLRLAVCTNSCILIYGAPRGYELMLGFHLHLFVEMYVTSLFPPNTKKTRSKQQKLKIQSSGESLGKILDVATLSQILKNNDICMYPLSFCVFETLSRYTRQLAAISSYRWCQHLKRVSLTSLVVWNVETWQSRLIKMPFGGWAGAHNLRLITWGPLNYHKN